MTVPAIPRHSELSALIPMSLDAQLDPDTRSALALLLCFDGGEKELGFRQHLQRIPPLTDGFTLCDAVAAYAMYLIKYAASGMRQAT